MHLMVTNSVNSFEFYCIPSLILILFIIIIFIIITIIMGITIINNQITIIMGITFGNFFFTFLFLFCCLKVYLFPSTGGSLVAQGRLWHDGDPVGTDQPRQATRTHPTGPLLTWYCKFVTYQQKIL